MISLRSLPKTVARCFTEDRRTKLIITIYSLRIKMYDVLGITIRIRAK